MLSSPPSRAALKVPSSVKLYARTQFLTLTSTMWQDLISAIKDPTTREPMWQYRENRWQIPGSPSAMRRMAMVVVRQKPLLSVLGAVSSPTVMPPATKEAASE